MPRPDPQPAAAVPRRPQSLIADGVVDTVVVAFTDMQGRLQGKRLHAAYFVDVAMEHGTEGCNYLLGVDVDMNTVAGYAMTSWDKGYGDMEFALDLDTVRVLPHLPGTAMVQCDLVWFDHSPVEPSPRHVLRQQLDRAAEMGFVALAGTELEFIVFEDTYEDAWDARYQRPHAVQPLQRRLLDHRHLAHRAPAPRDPQRDVRRGHERGGRQGGVQPRSARDRLPVRRRAHDRRQPLGLQDLGEGDRRQARQVADVHAEVQRARGELLPHPPLAARHRRGRGLLGRRPAHRALRPLRRRCARDDAGLHPPLRAERQLLQAVRRRLVRADRRRLGQRQPHLLGTAGRAAARRRGWRTGFRAAT